MIKEFTFCEQNWKDKDGKVSVIEVTKETYMSYQIGDIVFMDILTGEQK